MRPLDKILYSFKALLYTALAFVLLGNSSYSMPLGEHGATILAWIAILEVITIVRKLDDRKK
ncbi:hypothetical protein GCM10011351_20520 [Paraliobacillus quinghaiensis]|uniref:Uncharacterized protein n=1 Tax=Paraliobacillus quinghaiensis TaxID=470815 RepID=A0A917TS28_9BACI|nr:hypothetical protein [Paraliobacillus quinghaiensis]GGM34456.1 hypothetical protein GCM10011351_20520 [Paraliobacillus quinghaiensis]